MNNKINFTIYLIAAIAFTVAVVIGLSHLTIEGFSITHISDYVTESPTGALQIVPCQ